jgi:hypothetical protein
MKHAATQELYGYWRWLCQGRAAPERNDIDPAEIRGVLADTFMLEIEGTRPTERSFPVRLSGTRINALFGEEIKGGSLLSLWRPEDRTDLADLIDSVLDDTQPAVAGSLAAPTGHAPLSLELILLPLRHKGRTHARMLGALSPISIPSWLGLVPVEGLTLTSQRMINPAAIGMQCASRTGMTEMHLPYRERRAIRRGHFIVYDGGKHADAHEQPKARARVY